MAGGGQGPSTSAGLVDRSGIGVSQLELILLSRLQVDDGEAVKQDLWVRLSDHHLLPVPVGPVQKQALGSKQRYSTPSQGVSECVWSP